MIIVNKKAVFGLAFILLALIVIPLLVFLLAYHIPQKHAFLASKKQKTIEFTSEIQGLDMPSVLVRFEAFQQNEMDNPFLNDAKMAVVDQIKNSILSQYKSFDYSNKNSYVKMQELSETIASFSVLKETSVLRFAESYLDMMNSNHTITINSIQVTTSYGEGVYFDKCVCLSDGIPKVVVFEKETGIITSQAPLPYFSTPRTFPCRPWYFEVDAFAYRHKKSSGLLPKKDDEKGWQHCIFAPGEGSKENRRFEPDDRIGFNISYSINFKTLTELLSDAGISIN